MADDASSGRLTHAQLAKLSGLSQTQLDEFARTWPDLPLRERRRVARALGDMAQDNVELNYNDLFHRLVRDPDPEVRVAAVDGLWEDERTLTADRLLEMADHDPDETVRAAAIDGLARFTRRMALDEVEPRLADRIRTFLAERVGPDQPTGIRRRAIEAFGYLGGDPANRAIDAAYASSDLGLRASAVSAMGRTCDPRWIPTILDELKNDDAEIRFEAAQAAGEMEDEAAVPALIDALSDEDPEVRLAAIEALGAIGGQRARSALQQVRRNGDEAERQAAETALDELEIAADPFGVRVVGEIDPN